MAQSSDYYRYNSNSKSNGYITNSPPRDTFVRGGQRATIHGTQAAKSWSKNKSKGKEKKESKKTTMRRSNSSLEMDSIDYIDVDEFHTGVYRDYGSTSSLDVLGKSNDSFFDLIKVHKDVTNLDQRSPAPAKLQELLRGKNEGVRFHVSNGSAVKSSEDVTDSPKNKSKFKHKDRKSRSKSITTETRPGIFTKLRGKTDTEVNPKTPENIDVDVRAEERLRSKAFLHYDCQSISFDVEETIRNISNPFCNKNKTTGASAASQKDGSQSDDNGDDKCNDLVLKCPFFRNEIGGEEERIVSLGRMLNKSKNTQNSAILTRSPACCGLSILDSSPTPTGLILPHIVLHRNHVMEYVDHGASYYRHFFYGYGKFIIRLLQAFYCNSLPLHVHVHFVHNREDIPTFQDSLEDLTKPGKKKKIYVFPIAWSSKLGSVGRDFFFFFKPTNMHLPLKSHKLVCFILTTAY